MKSVSISIPAYNNEKTIKSLVEESLEVLSGVVNDYEVVVIDDGSRDLTAEIIDSLKSEKVKVYHHKINEGFGKTIREVFFLPNKELIFFIPGDAQFPPSELLKFLTLCEKYDYILGVRKNRQDSIVRIIISKIYNFLISILAGKRVKDVNSIALLRKSAIQNFEIHSKGAFVHAEIFLKLVKGEFAVGEVEVNHRPRLYGKSGALRLKVIFSTLRDFLIYIIGRL